MKLFQFNKRYDFGHEVYLSFLTIKGYTLLQLSFDYSDYEGYPYLQITSGNGRLFGFLLNMWRLGFCLDFIARNWSWCYDTDLPDITLEELKDGN
jgi:hypothetical protein